MTRLLANLYSNPRAQFVTWVVQLAYGWFGLSTAIIYMKLIVVAGARQCRLCSSSDVLFQPIAHGLWYSRTCNGLWFIDRFSFNRMDGHLWHLQVFSPTALLQWLMSIMSMYVSIVLVPSYLGSYITFSWIVIAVISKWPLKVESAGSLTFITISRNLAMESMTHQGISSYHLILEHSAERVELPSEI